MQRTRRKQFNPIDAPSLARWILITAFLSVTGLIYVYLSLQLYDLGKQKNKLEQTLVALRSESDVASGQIAALTSYPALQRRLKEGYLRMRPIEEHNIVRLNVLPGSRGEDSIQPVSNPHAGR